MLQYYIFGNFNFLGVLANKRFLARTVLAQNSILKEFAWATIALVRGAYNVNMGWEEVEVRDCRGTYSGPIGMSGK